MSNSLQQSIIQKVREFLRIDEECSATELYSKLREYRNQMHPDKFSDESSKEHAEANFKKAQELLPELFRYIQDEAIHRTPAELSLYKPVYDHVFTQEALDAARKEIDDLKQRLEWSDHLLIDLRKKLGNQKKDEFEAERRRLESLYRPTKSRWASLGITLLLSGALAVMTKMEEVSGVLKKYSPVEENMLNTSLFFIFIVIFILMLKRLIENSLMKKRVREVCAAKAPIDFMEQLEKSQEIGQHESFTEYDVFTFVHGPERWWKKLLSFLGFVHYQIVTSEQLKSFFISTLLQKELVAISHAERLNRRFKIRKKQGDWDI